MAEIFASEYNSLRSRINAIMVTEYGQTLNATTNVTGDYVTNTTNTDKVTAQQWNNLYIDMVRARTHQNNSFTQQSLWLGDYNTNTTSTDKVAQADLTYLSGLMTDIETNNRVLDVANQAAISTIATSSRSTGWNTTIDHGFTVTFSSANARTNFFNAGGQIRFNGSIAYTGSESKTLDWQSLLSGMGNITMDYTQTFSSASVGTGSAIGNQDLTGTYQLLYERTAATYSVNNYRVFGRADSTSVLRFLIQFNDADNPPGDGIDENVQGTTTSNGIAVTPDGSVTISGTPYDTVVLSAPSGSNTNTL